MKKYSNTSTVGKVITRHSSHFITMINFNFECYDCGYDNSVSLSEEEDLLEDPICTCSNCRANNLIKLSDIYDNNF